MAIFLRLFLAHLLADFVFQSTKMVKNKQEQKIKAPQLYLHCLIHLVLYYVFLWDMEFWYLPLMITASHYLIDLGKLYLSSPTNSRLLFFIDQALHIGILLSSSLYLSNTSLTSVIVPSQLLPIAVTFIFLTQPTSIIIKTLISVYTPKTALDKEDSLQNAGRYIGMLERLLIFVFIATNHWEGVGFLIAAKSVFRFSDLTQAKDRKLTEYILIGTLLSFSIAVGCSLLFLEFSA